jgi:hypothetical protein
VKPIQWRNAIRDSSMDATAKHTAHVISTYMNGAGDSFPGKETIARGASLSVRAVDEAIKRIEAAGFLKVVRSPGGRPNHYWAKLPHPADAAGSTPQEMQGSETADPAADDNEPRSSRHQTPQLTTSNPAGAAPESVNEIDAEVEPKATDSARPAISQQNVVAAWSCDVRLKHGDICGSSFPTESALQRHKLESHWESIGADWSSVLGDMSA